MQRELKVGLLLLAAVVILGSAVFLIGRRDHVFSTKNRYTISFDQVGGLAEGATVQLSGVAVGQVESVDLPPTVTSKELTVTVSIERQYADRVRQDSVARIKTLGLLGDKYLEITSGTPEAPVIPPGGSIPAAPPTNVDQLITSGEDFVDNIVAISISLRDMLARMERGEGVLGQLTSEGETAQSMRHTLQALERVLASMEEGEGTLGKLLNDEGVFVRLDNTLSRLERTVAKIEEGEGALGLLVNDVGTRESLERTLANLDQASTSLVEMTEAFEAGEGLLPKLLHDPEYGDRVAEDLRAMAENLRLVSERLESGDGTVGALINDPEAYQALTDILVGVDENRFLRWLVRNRQKKGTRIRYDEAVDAGEIPPVGEDANEVGEPSGDGTTE